MIVTREAHTAPIKRAGHWPGLALLMVVAGLLLFLFVRVELALTGGEVGVPLDDAWIHYQFARNLSQGNGFSYNPGEATPGSTAPLWTLLLAGVGMFTEDFIWPSLFLSAAFFLLSAGLTYGLTYRLLGSRLAALLAALGATLAGRMVWAGLAGMETTAFAALSLAAVWLYSRQGLRPLPALLFALASQMRPEGHALFALALVDSGWVFFTAEARREAGDGSASRFAFLFSASRQFLFPLLVYALVAAPYVVFSLATTGKPLPNTFYAKAGSEYLFSWRTLKETAWLHWADNPVSLLLVALGLRPAWRRCRLAVLWLLALPLFMAFTIDFTWHHGRYTMPLIPFQMIVGAAGAWWVIKRLEIRGWRLDPFGKLRAGSSASPSRTQGFGRARIGGRDRDWRVGTLAGVLVLFFVSGGVWQLPNWARMLGTNSKEILETDVALGYWLAENTPADTLMAVDDIGAIAFLSGRRIVDLNGLVSPEMWPAIQQPIGLPRNQVATRILSELQPDYLAGFPLWHWEIATNPAVAEPIHRVTTDTHTIIAEQEVVVFRVTWPYQTQASPSVPHMVTLGEHIRLVGHDLVEPAAGQPVALTLYWESVRPVAADYDVFVHVLDVNNEIVAQADQEPVAGLAPTHLWQAGDVVRDPYRLEMPPDLAAGTYRIRVGMYLRQTGERLPATGGTVVDNAAELAVFEWPSS